MKITLSRHTDKVRTRRVLELSLLMEQMKTETKQKLVTSLRERLPYYRPGEKCLPARELPRILFAIARHKKTNAPDKEVYNGLILLSVGNLASKQEAEALRNQAAGLPPTLAVFIGSSGHTVKILVSYCLPDHTLPQQREQMEWFHAHAYRHAAQYYHFHLRRDISLRLPSPEEGCRLSYDPDLYYNPEVAPTILAQPVGMPKEPTYTEKKKKEIAPLEQLMPGYERNHILSVLFHASVQKAWEKMGEEEDMQVFLLHLSRCCYHSGIPEAEAVKWTLLHDRQSFAEPAVRFTFRTTYQFSDHFGKRPSLSPETIMQYQLDDFMKRHYDLRFNSMLDTVEYRDRSSFYFDFQPINKRVQNSMVIRAQKEGIPLWDRDVKRYLESEHISIHHPIEEYLDRLPPADGKDHIGQLADRVPCDNPHWRGFFHTWFLSMVAHWRQMDHKHGNSCSPLLIGPQGCGKSTFCSNLLPPPLKMYFTDSIDFGRKRDAELFLHRFALINMDEFDQISPVQQGFLKHILQKPVVNTRKPYETFIGRLQRYASFIATSNHSDLLSDTSGNRRYIVARIKGTLDLQSPIPYDQLYAQAIAELRAGKRYWFSPKEEAILMKNNKEFEKQSLDEQLFLRYFRPGKEDEPNVQMMRGVEIIEHLQKRSRMKLSQTHLNYFSRLMHKLEVPCKHLRHGNFYYVVKLEA